jgi:hypothetical protein
MSVGTVRRAAVAADVAATALAAPGVAGAAYSLVPSPNAFSGNNVLNGVSGASATDAWAVGSLCCSARHFGLGTLSEHWNGTNWTIVPSPDTKFNDDVLNGVAAISPNDAWAVGNVNQTSFKSRQPLIVHWNGSSWTSVAAPAGLTGFLRAVSADSSSDVWAVGDDQHGHATVIHYDGAAWSQVTVPTAAGSSALQGVKALSPTDVWLVGDQVASGTTVIAKTLIEHWNGARWSIVPSPNPDPSSNILHAIGGASATDLWAVGQKGRDESTTGVPPGTRTLAMHWNGTAWTAASSPSLGDQDTLNGVAATATTNAQAVGTFNNTSGSIPVARSLAERWTGTSWVTESTPNVGTTDNLLNGVAALPGTSTLFAVGFHLTVNGPYQTLILRSG